MANGSTRCIFSSSSLHGLCLCKLIEELDHYSPEMLSLLPPVQRKELLLLCPVVSICHLEQTCAFDEIDSDTFWDDLLKNQESRLRSSSGCDINALKALRVSYSSSREKYFTFLTAVIFSGDRFSGVYGWFVDGREFYEGCSPPPEERSCPDDIVNYLVAYRKPKTVDVTVEKVNTHQEDPDLDEDPDLEEEHYSDNDNNFYYPLPSRDTFGRQHGELYEESTKGQYIHSRYSHYISKENHYRLSDDDAVSLMMNECNFYPKRLFLHEYEYMHWNSSHDDLTRLLRQFFGKLELLSLYFRQGKDIDSYVSTVDCSMKALEVVLSCCFSSPIFSSLVTALDNTANEVLSATLAAKPCSSLKMLDISCGIYYSGEEPCLEVLAKIITSHSQLTELCVLVHTQAKVDISSFACLYTSLIDFVQRQEFSKLTLKGLVPMSSHLKVLLNTFFKMPCSQPQKVHLQGIEPVHNEATTTHVPVGDGRVPSGALEYKSLCLDSGPSVTMDFCQWLFSHESLVLKAFNFDASISKPEHGEFLGLRTRLNIREPEHGELLGLGTRLGELVPPPETAFPIHLLSDNASFQTQELSLPMSIDIPNQALQNIFHHQQLTRLSLQPVLHKPCNVDAITEILLCQKETLTELTISRKYLNYYSIEPSADMEQFGDALFSLRNFEIFSLYIAITWRKEDTSHIDRLYNRWLKHGRKKLKSFQMGNFEYQFSLTDELAAKLDKMGLVVEVY